MPGKERIRLNQRRSRARKQEYVKDLEKRIQDCHTTCRNADLQLESYQQLRKENQKLRALLGSIGVSDNQINSCINADPSNPATGKTSLRNIRPQLQLEANFPITNSTSPPHTLSGTSSNCDSKCPPVRSDTNEPYLTFSTTHEFQQQQHCLNPAMRATFNESILCSEAQELINPYNTTDQDIQEIGVQTGFWLGAGIQV